MIRKKTVGLVGSAVVAISLFAYAFQWQYSTAHVPGERIGSYQVTQTTKNIRTNRWTGEAQILTERGWVRMDSADPLSAAFRGLEK